MRQALQDYPDAVFVDTWDRFDGRNGGIAELIVDPRDGRAKPVRQSDGFHLNEDGAEILAIDIAAEVESILAGPRRRHLTRSVEAHRRFAVLRGWRSTQWSSRRLPRAVDGERGAGGLEVDEQRLAVGA